MSDTFSPFVLAQRVDHEVEKFRKKFGKLLPGMTVALAREGAVVLARGYGTANASTGEPMRANTMSITGSTCKAYVTAATGALVLADHGITTDKKLYGLQGLYGGELDDDVQIGARRHSPIIDVAIDPEDRVHTWFVDGTVTIGHSDDLSSNRQPFKLPEGKQVHDIVGIGISRSRRVVVFYSDKTISYGTATELAKDWEWLKEDGQVVKDADGVPVKAQWRAADRADGKRQPGEAIVGIDLAPDNDVYVWYHDGTVSHGDLLNFGSGSQCVKFTCAKRAGGSAREIRGVGIAADSRVYTFFSNGTVSVGSSTQLNEHKQPSAYKLPVIEAKYDRWEWFKSITLQHLLDHNAGFAREVNIDNVADFLGKKTSELTYEEVHRYFLSVLKLERVPGSSGEDYSNHGMGCWTLIIEHLTKRRFPDVVRDRYLKKFGLGKLIEARTDPDHPLVSKQHLPSLSKNSAEVHFFPCEQIELGAGGYRTSARGAVTATLKLVERHGNNAEGFAQLDKQAWKRVNGRLCHGGSGAGLATISMFPPGAMVDEIDCGGVHVAVILNVSNPEWTTMYADMGTLSLTLTALVPTSTEPAAAKLLRNQIFALLDDISALELVLEQDTGDGGGGPTIKPGPLPPNAPQLAAKLAQLQQQLAEARALADKNGWKIGPPTTAEAIAGGA